MGKKGRQWGAAGSRRRGRKRAQVELGQEDGREEWAGPRKNTGYAQNKRGGQKEKGPKSKRGIQIRILNPGITKKFETQT